MTKKFRDLLFNLFIVVFIIGTVALSLYASGYKFNLSFPLDFNRLLVKTGIIALDSNPKNATIFINGQKEPSISWRPWKKTYLSTPAKIRNLIPGDYEIVIEKPGYWPFKTILRVNSGLTTFYEDISLFKSDNPTIKTISDESIAEEILQLSPNHHFLYLERSAKIINLAKNDEERKIFVNDYADLDEDIKNQIGLWQKNNELLLGGIFLSPENEAKDRNFLSIIGLGAYNWKFIDNKLFYQNAKSLSSLDVSQNIAEVVLPIENIINYLIEGDKLLIIINDNNQVFLKEYSLEKKVLSSELILPNDGNYHFQEIKNNFLSVYDKKNNSLYLIEIDNINKGYRTVKSVKDWSWDEDGGIFFITDWELQYFNIKENRFQLLARLSSNLERLLINKEKNYLLLFSKTNINVLDLKTNHITTILEAEKIISPVIDKDEDLLYFWGQIKDQQGVYRISIK